LLMRAVVCLLAVLFLAAASSAVAQENHLIDPMLPGSLDPEPLPPLKNPNAPSTPAKELFARKSTPFPGPPRSIGGDFDSYLAGAVSLPITGPTWQVMQPSRNRNWDNPQLIRFARSWAEPRSAPRSATAHRPIQFGHETDSNPSLPTVEPVSAQHWQFLRGKGSRG
jgi:hypothetical protein